MAVAACPDNAASGAVEPETKAVAELRFSDLDEIDKLGEGACGEVTKVRLRGSSAEFALKIAYYDNNDPEGEMEVLRRVAQSGSPYIVGCHATFRGPADEPAMLLELMDAGSLSRVVRSRGGHGLPEPALAEVAARCLAGLVHLHSRGVAHLDLKPDNILANSRGDVKICDFSVSRIFLSPDGESRRISISVGAPEYLSPEGFKPNAHAGPRGACAADVWSLGITVMKLFLGDTPILPADVRSSWVKIKEAILYGEPPSFPESSSASAELRGFVTSCLQKNPKQRSTVAQLLAHPFVARRDVEASRHQLREIIVETMQ
ncbi:hypothetical protein GUJ93_ZPchr0007g4502 [Zizania palustris]|uniref:Protein kinase domain-containing protein n=1 Tax=Zizania palustris TaxID=103762 RepID=A0A8J5TDS4_ZIZPA|nr:hypothetical protein GUJ93_ZPchr0007g4502 [Zizania palustris]